MIKILSPVNGAKEAQAVIDAGAEELYCGVMPGSWKKNYTNLASPNRREWANANMTTFDELADVVSMAHGKKARVFLTMNALYTELQYKEIEPFIKEATRAKVDAIIIADIGVLLDVRRMGWEGEIHVSTGGTTFNDESVMFYKDLGATRVVIPRQNRVSEIARLARHSRGIEIETFVMNCGCKNIDGFCTFHHGVNEVSVPLWWNIPKKLHGDYYLLDFMKRLPEAIRDPISHSSAFGSVSACFLSYKIDVKSETASNEQKEAVHKALRRNFNLFSGFDTCGACALKELQDAGVCSVKIVGRSNPVGKKVQDVRFLRSCLDYINETSHTKDEILEYSKKMYKKVFGYKCDDWCYFPTVDANLTADEL